MIDFADLYLCSHRKSPVIYRHGHRFKEEPVKITSPLLLLTLMNQVENGQTFLFKFHTENFYKKEFLSHLIFAQNQKIKKKPLCKSINTF